MKKLYPIFLILLSVPSPLLFAIQESVYETLNGGSPIENTVIDEAVLINIDINTMLLVYTTGGELKAVRTVDAGQSFEPFPIDMGGRQISSIHSLEGYRQIENDWIFLFIGNEEQSDNLYALIHDESGQLSLGFGGPLNTIDTTADVGEYKYYENMYKSFMTTFVVDNRLAYFYYNSFTDQVSRGFFSSENSVLQNYYISDVYDENDRIVYLILAQITDVSNNTSLRSYKLDQGIVSENLEIATFPPGEMMSIIFFKSNIGNHSSTVFSVDKDIFFYNYSPGQWNLVDQINMTSVPEKMVSGESSDRIVFSSYFEENGTKKFYYDIENKTVEDEYIQISTIPLRGVPVQLRLNSDRISYVLPEENGEFIDLILYNQLAGESVWNEDNSYYSPPVDIKSYFIGHLGATPYIVTLAMIGTVYNIFLHIYDYNDLSFSLLLQEELLEEESDYFFFNRAKILSIENDLLSLKFPNRKIQINIRNMEIQTDFSMAYTYLGNSLNKFYFFYNTDNMTFLSVSGMGE
ncbi:MAG: hypothetical protein L3J12_08185 [Spirochaetales bacterium]|nr:hypothetical protein [Spirochaetales bacterium]